MVRKYGKNPRPDEWDMVNLSKPWILGCFDRYRENTVFGFLSCSRNLNTNLEVVLKGSVFWMVKGSISFQSAEDEDEELILAKGWIYKWRLDYLGRNFKIQIGFKDGIDCRIRKFIVDLNSSWEAVSRSCYSWAVTRFMGSSNFVDIFRLAHAEEGKEPPVNILFKY